MTIITPKWLVETVLLGCGWVLICIALACIVLWIYEYKIKP